MLAAVVPLALLGAERTPNPREVIPLDSGWRFQLGDEPAAKAPAFADSAWRTLDLPHDWSIEGPFTPPPEGEKNGGFFTHGIGWYRKSFTLPASAAGKKVVVEFEGVYMNSDAWINGHFLGRRPYGFVEFRYDLTEFLNQDGTANVLAVRVDDSAEPALRWYAGSGIYRGVHLVMTSYTHFKLDGGIRVSTPQVAADGAVVQTDAIIDAHFFTESERQAWLKDAWHVKPTKRDLLLSSTVIGADGSEVATTASTVSIESMRSGQRATQWLTVKNPRLWSDRTPELYRLRCTLSLDGVTLDETTTPFGIRQLIFDPDKGLLVNGRPTKLKGVCLHQDAGSFGNAVPAAVWAWRLGQLKEMGCNAVRTSHHPFAPEFYDLCDRLGLYVFDESFDEWTRDWTYNYTENTRGKSPYGYHLYFEQWHEADLRSMLRRDRNHPSVVLYSIGNEIPDQFNDDGWKIAKSLVAICHEEDPTRPATSACDQSFVSSRNGFMDALDLAGYNYIDRLYGDRTYAPERERFPHRLCLGTETTNQVRNWLGVRDNDFVIGEFIWTGIDYLGESSASPRRGSASGFLDLAGGRKPEYFRRAAYWREDPVLQVSVLTGEKPDRPTRPERSLIKWNWPAGSLLTVRAVTNCDEVELFLNGASLGRHTVSPNVYASDWSVPYAPGTLSAVAYRAGQKVASQELRTAGASAQVRISPLSSPIASGVSLYEILVVDSTGQTVTDAALLVTVRVGGAGRLIGLDTGDLGYVGLFKTPTRDAYLGRLLATVERTEGTGPLQITATTPGLPPSTFAAEEAPGTGR
ncbi:MAG TPA: glycoside hydrolase family 2 TIM barrel-domain containing protein [Opitutaceae bacterium]